MGVRNKAMISAARGRVAFSRCRGHDRIHRAQHLAGQTIQKCRDQLCLGAEMIDQHAVRSARRACQRTQACSGQTCRRTWAAILGRALLCGWGRIAVIKALGLFAHQHAGQIMHGQQKPIGHILQIRIACARLHPMRRQVQVVDRAVDVVDIARPAPRGARCPIPR